MPPPQSSSQVPLPERLQGVVEGSYVVHDELDRGGRGAVYLADDTRHGRKVAIKVMLPEVADAVGVSRFLQEISIAARLNHPHILPLYDSGEADGLLYYVMPYVKGRSLKDRLSDEGPLALDEVRRIASEVGSALERAHREGIVHRDIKPANILLVGSHAAITDFGIARAIDSAANLVETGAGVFMGTGSYMSPEQAAGEGDLDGRTDQYSLACTVFEMIAGAPPYPGPSLRQVLTQHLVSPVPSLRAIRRDVPDYMDQAVARALAKEPADRFVSVMEFARALNTPLKTGLWSRLRSGVETAERSVRTATVVERPATKAPVVSCPGCGVDVTRGSKFCGECGTRLADAEVTTSLLPSSELRQLTVLALESEGWDAVAARLGPARAEEIARDVADRCRQEIARYEGHVVQEEGHAMVAYFGFPVAHEDAPVRAGLAGLGIQQSMRELSVELELEGESGLAVRIGIHTGAEVMDSAPETNTQVQRLTHGITPIVARMLRDEAPPDAMLVSETTQRLFRGFFTCLEIGLHRVEEDDDPILSYRLLSESGLGRRVEASPGRELPPIVGRDAELAEVMKRWDLAVDAKAQLVLLEGEAGIGKSRLLAGARKQIGQAHLLLEAGCSPYHTNTALYGLIRLLEDWIGIHPDDPADERFTRLRSLVEPLLPTERDAVPLLAALLSIPPGEARYEALSLDPAHQRRRTLEVVLAWMRVAASRQPMLVILDDLHWVDPSTLEFITMWLDRARGASIMMLTATRPDFEPPWDAPHVTRVALSGLSDTLARELVRNVTGGKDVPDQVVDQVVARADGVPLFVEETTRALIEAGHLVETPDRFVLSGALPETAIPSTLRDALTARMDRLGSAKGLVQLGAVIGREFSAALLGEVAEVADWVALGAELGKAVDSGILDARGSGPRTRYSFRHALIQENAYQSLVSETRREHHRKIMGALANQALGPGSVDPARVAYHCTEAGAVERAVPYWLAAGQQAHDRAAFTEAERYLSKGLELVATIRESPQRDRDELELQRALGAALQASRGYAAPEVERAYARAHALSRKSGEVERVLPVLWGQHMFNTVRAQYHVAGGVANEMVELAENSGDAAHLMLARLATALSHLYLGSLETARDEFRASLELYDPTDWPREKLFVGEPRCVCYSYLARTLWILGDVDEALELSHRSLTLARTLNEAAAQASGLGMHTLLLLMHRDVEQAREYAAESIAFATRHGFAYWLVLGGIFDGWLKAQDGKFDEGIGVFAHCLDLYQKQGAKLGLSWFFGGLAEMYAQAGKLDEAAGLLAKAEAHVRETDELYYAPEVLRLQAGLELIGGTGSVEVAHEKLSRALQIAGEQKAVSWQLRASVALARSLRDEGRVREAVEALRVLDGIARPAAPGADYEDAVALRLELGKASPGA